MSFVILSNSSFVRSPASKNVLTYSFASLVDTLDAFAITDARKADDLAGSIADAERTSFISYLKGASFWVLSIACLFDPVFTLGFDLFGPPFLSEPPLFCVDGFLTVLLLISANEITPLNCYLYCVI